MKNPLPLKSNNTLYVITGGPGVGKTTLINELSTHGFVTVPEDARKIIKEQIRTHKEGLPWKDKAYYAELMIKASVTAYQKINGEHTSKIIFFDRGIIDAIGYMKMENIMVSEDINTIAGSYRYAKKVFILPPWKEIYETDTERKQSWKEAADTFEALKKTYLQYNYEVIELPKDTVEDRRLYIQNIIKIDL